MQNTPFRDHHLLQLLEIYGEENRPLDVSICNYFRANKALGSKDRAEISENAYALIRWYGLLSAIKKKGNWADFLELVREQVWTRDNSGFPLHVQVSFPEDLYARLVETLGADAAHAFCYASNFPAPTYVRVNTAKISREDLLNRLTPKYSVAPTENSPEGILFKKKVHFYSMEEFKLGYFEVQDEASQLVASLVDVKPGQQVMDYCAGAGGKSLAIAAKMQQKGQLYLHDIRAHALQEARQRLKRAGVQNYQTLPDGNPALKKLKKKMDWVLVDAPCSGTGTLRRNPDMKWGYSDEMLERLVGQQRMIFEKALSYLSPNGRIVYATCSVLKEENMQQLEHFIKTYNLRLVGEPLQTIPGEGQMDGFFGAVLEFAQI